MPYYADIPIGNECEYSYFTIQNEYDNFNINYTEYIENDCEKTISYNKDRLFNLNFDDDNFIIIAVAIFLFMESSVDITTLIALGLLFFSNNS